MQENSRWHAFDDAKQIAVAASQQILTAAERAIADHGAFKLVLAGGKTPADVYRLLAQAHADWSKWWIFYGDERSLPADHPDRNSVMASQAWLNNGSIPAEQIHTIPTEIGTELAAAFYQPLVAAALPFDVVLLGVGEDGHTASLFPGHQHDQRELVHAVYHSPKPPSERVTLSVSALSSSHEVIFLLAGGDKQGIVKRWRLGDELPVANIQSENPIDIYSLKTYLEAVPQSEYSSQHGTAVDSVRHSHDKMPL
ncbi:MAG: 6-phosphogluconolactonase [Methylococcales bacterium]|nr:6-phosphogluconolactonase [Methylococcaceae bacterium]